MRMGANLGNCPRCGRLYVKALHDVCINCVKEIDAEYDRCWTYLRENKQANMTELSDATDVSIKQITKFIREGRISIKDAPHLSFPCEMCGTLITAGNLCVDCRSTLLKGMKDTTGGAASKDNETKHEEAYRGLGRYKN